MDLPKRVFYYLIGVSLGAVIVYFIWEGKGVSFDYGMDARTLKTIRIRTKIYSKEAQFTLEKNKLDTLAVNYILKNGDVNFGKSNQHEKPCAKYMVYGKYKEKLIDLWIDRCDSTAIIQKVFIK